jgi:hypothetical protein
MKDSIIVVLLVLLMFSLPLITSTLLDWSFIIAHISRALIVHLLMIIEIIAIFIVLLSFLKSKN